MICINIKVAEETMASTNIDLDVPTVEHSNGAIDSVPPNITPPVVIPPLGIPTIEIPAVSEDRSADHSIQGFLYQFNKTLVELLNADEDATVTIEGAIEDIDLTTSSGTTAIQCKYHESQAKFTLGCIYKPLLQMMHHFHQNPASGVTYRIYAFFPDRDGHPEYVPTKEDLQAAIASSDKKLQRYAQPLRGSFNPDSVGSRITVVFGLQYDALVQQVRQALLANGFPEDEIDTLVYPNALEFVANISIKHSVLERQTSKGLLLTRLRSVRTTAITRWTLALKTKAQILKARRKQLKVNLDKNVRTRYFLIPETAMENFSERIVIFIKDFLDHYHYKAAHIKTPLFCLRCDDAMFEQIQYRLYSKGVNCNDGFLKNKFISERLFREPIVQGKGNLIQREFLVSLLRIKDNLTVLNERHCDDLFVVGDVDCGDLDLTDVNEERLGVQTWKELYYLVGLNHDYT